MSSVFNGNRFTKPVDSRVLRYPVAASQVISIGDFLYWNDTDKVVAPMSVYVGSGTAATDHTALAALFVGVAGQSRIASQVTAGEIQVITECVYEADCASTSSLLPGQAVSVVSSGASAAGAIQDYKVVVTATAGKAIGVVVGAYKSGALTKVTVRLIGLAARNTI